MNVTQVLLCSVFAVSLSLGQVLFKKAALAWETASQGGKNFPFSLMSSWLIGAVIAYGLTTLLWLFILRNISLSQAYVFSIAGSAIVPIMAYLVFKESMDTQFVIGFIITMIGVILCIR